MDSMRTSAMVPVAILTAFATKSFAAENFLPDDTLVARVEQRVHELQPTRGDPNPISAENPGIPAVLKIPAKNTDYRSTGTNAA